LEPFFPENRDELRLVCVTFTEALTKTKVKLESTPSASRRLSLCYSLGRPGISCVEIRPSQADSKSCEGSSDTSHNDSDIRRHDASPYLDFENGMAASMREL
jgi:hypothetical protein